MNLHFGRYLYFFLFLLHRFSYYSSNRFTFIVNERTSYIALRSPLIVIAPCSVATILISIYSFHPSPAFIWYSVARCSASYDFIFCSFHKVSSNLKIEELIVWLMNMNKRKKLNKKQRKKNCFHWEQKAKSKYAITLAADQNHRLRLLWYCHDTFAFLFSNFFFSFFRRKFLNMLKYKYIIIIISSFKVCNFALDAKILLKLHELLDLMLP